MDELVENPDGCTRFEPNAFKRVKCKQCGRPWHEHKGVITEAHVDGMVKLSQDGEALWTYRRSGGETISNAASLLDGAAYTTTTAGRALALSMETGQEIWSTTVASSTDGMYGQVSAHEGVVIAGADASQTLNKGRKSCCGPANHQVVGLNSTDGRVLWRYTPETPVWNFMASFVGDGTFVFQDLEGRAHRCKVSDGSLIWKSGGFPGTWTDGSALVGPNGIVYTVATFKNGGFTPGAVSAFRLSDGTQLWNRTVPKPPSPDTLPQRYFLSNSDTEQLSSAKTGKSKSGIEATEVAQPMI